MYTRVDSGPGTTVVVASPFLAFTSAEIAKHFRLTPTQTRVAGLLACRRSNAEIAAALRISPNTARRHTEAVMFRMRASCRGDVERLIKERLSFSPDELGSSVNMLASAQ
jgi:DNA-binding CsgD family transcriptional regulator